MKVLLHDPTWDHGSGEANNVLNILDKDTKVSFQEKSKDKKYNFKKSRGAIAPLPTTCPSFVGAPVILLTETY